MNVSVFLQLLCIPLWLSVYSLNSMLPIVNVEIYASSRLGLQASFMQYKLEVCLILKAVFYELLRLPMYMYSFPFLSTYHVAYLLAGYFISSWNFRLPSFYQVYSATTFFFYRSTTTRGLQIYQCSCFT